jgi:hypothetical protein
MSRKTLKSLMKNTPYLFLLGSSNGPLAGILATLFHVLSTVVAKKVAKISGGSGCINTPYTHSITEVRALMDR